MLGLYLIKAETEGYDRYDSAVVCAEDEDDARSIHPDGGVCDDISDKRGTWRLRKCVTAKFLGWADMGINRGLICASFHAG